MSKHTKGPWTFDASKGQVSSAREAIAFVNYTNDAIANGNLLAEAPAMLEALRDLLGEESFEPSAVARAKAIIARIDGAS